MSLVELERPKSAVPGQYLGYGLQPVRLCYHLLSVPKGFKVSMEHVEDIAIHGPASTLILEQTKSALTGNPAADRSSDLWNTLANWSELPLRTLELVESFRYYVTPSKAGPLVSQLHDARDVLSSDTLLKKFRSRTFIGKLGVGIEPHISRFIAAGDDVCRRVIERFEFVSEPNPLSAIQAKLTATIPDASLDEFCAAAIGIAKDEVEKLIRDGLSPIVDASRFRRKFRAFVRKYDFSGLLLPTVPTPADHQITQFIRNPPIFVRQLEAVDATATLITIAVSDYLRATADKINWADRGDIVDDSLAEMDISLIRHHEMAEDELIDTHRYLEPAERGRTLYRRCASAQMPLEGRVLPSYFVAGEFNSLAEECRLGWHPDHRTMFRKG